MGRVVGASLSSEDDVSAIEVSELLLFELGPVIKSEAPPRRLGLSIRHPD